MGLLAPVVRLHRRLLPERDYIGWTPYVWLIYLSLFAVQAFDAALAPGVRAGVVAGVLVFLALYFRGYWTRGRETLAIMAGIALLGCAFLPVTHGAAVFFVYAGAFSGNVGPPRAGGKALAAVVLVFLAAGVTVGVPRGLFGSLLAVTLLVGLVNIYYTEMGRKRAALRVSEEERSRLAVTAERERIARDLHDLLGHTLSVIAVKSELASRLIEKSPERAAAEIRDVERISREALHEVRAAVTGYRTSSLAAEVANARVVMDAVNVRFEAVLDGPPLPPDLDAALAMIVREAVTNVVRHANAARCDVRVSSGAGVAALRVSDDGRGGAFRERSGLSGMRERAAAHGGSIEIRTASGTEILVTIPLAGPIARHALSSGAATA